MLNSLSGRFLILTTVFVMLAEVMVFVPSVARFRQDYLLGHLERAQIASLSLLANDMIDADVEDDLSRDLIAALRARDPEAARAAMVADAARWARGYRRYAAPVD